MDRPKRSAKKRFWNGRKLPAPKPNATSDRDEAQEQPAAVRRVEPPRRDGRGADEQDRQRGHDREQPADRDDRADRERVLGRPADECPDRGGERAGDADRDEARERPEGDLPAEHPWPVEPACRIGHERGAGRGDDDPAGTEERRRGEQRRQPGLGQDPDEPGAGDHAADEDRRAARDPPREDRRGQRTGDDPKGLRRTKEADRAGIEAERAIEEVQVEERDPQAEAGKAARQDIERRIRPAERRRRVRAFRG